MQEVWSRWTTSMPAQLARVRNWRQHRWSSSGLQPVPQQCWRWHRHRREPTGQLELENCIIASRWTRRVFGRSFQHHVHDHCRQRQRLSKKAVHKSICVRSHQLHSHLERRDHGGSMLDTITLRIIRNSQTTIHLQNYSPAVDAAPAHGPKHALRHGRPARRHGSLWRS